ncbi:hypothetical protein P152DRAFT_410490 [Eremomyces bilateralis CBS 781.70]|uniref:phosphoinositide 5-phosphatase n=1 Tax=Eremomyces bilateralis CBS 781.70 TaxID=1392243 RepID=A0A6G1GBT9_9PEZI|nr:uncharacterized protein P152DRAFT_410490 [Eremomyces bilateralis CBS 781.70]KAF1815555.1 hypothetical protein P152DRAFT_410490 [Eremomyces bilateralis CBS 781.70]
MSIRVLIKDSSHRAIALATATSVLILRHSESSVENNSSGSSTSLVNGGANAFRCIVEFSSIDDVDLSEYRSLSSQTVHGTLGLISIANEVFLCVVSAAQKAATVRPAETVQKILAVEFHCLSSTDYDFVLSEEINPYPTDTLGDDGFERSQSPGRRESILEHPCLTLKKLLSSGTFYYSADFDVTRRLQDRPADVPVSVDSLDDGFLWNSFMIQPLVNFRARLGLREKRALDDSKIMTSAIRGFAFTLPVPASSSPMVSSRTGLPSQLTLISRLSCRRAGTRFNARGIDDDGYVANFVETETIFWLPDGSCFSYIQLRGSVPVFWEQTNSLIPGQQKITLSRSIEATQPAFDKHFEGLEYAYGPIHVVNLLSNDKPGELELTGRYHQHINNCVLNKRAAEAEKGHGLLKETLYDFHAETKGPTGYEAAQMIRQYIEDSANSFSYYLTKWESETDGKRTRYVRSNTPTLQQDGVFRTNCLDCLDRTNLVQTIISQLALELFFFHHKERGTSDFWMRHNSLWADNGDHLSKIYAGTGALKSSFTRLGKMSFAGAIADARKSAHRLYVNNFADKGRQNTMDMLLGRLMGQQPIVLYDPINDWVINEMNRRASEYSSKELINIWAGTFNLNGRTDGINEDLGMWLYPDKHFPEIFAVGFQEIVELSPQQIMSTDPERRKDWELSVLKALNRMTTKEGQDEYVLLRGGQLVGASLSVFVKSASLKHIKNVEASMKKTGMSGMAGNKGAVAIRMEYANTSICLVTAHLAAGFANYEERNRDYKTISQGLRFQRNRLIDDHDTVIWMGDFNYRIGLENEKVRKLISAGDLETLYVNDQLNIQMVAGLVFQYYSEARITFLPTYRFDIGTERYDTSEKQRIPAWCDRVLRKGTNIRQIHYNSVPLLSSDHRPVYATFECDVSLVDEGIKDKLSAELYNHRRTTVGDRTANTNEEDTDDEDLIGYESIEPGLPPASSDRRKWWLDNGALARVTVKAPGKEYSLNPNRPSNPFAPTSEPDWVRISPSNLDMDMHSPPKQIPRKLPPPYHSSSSQTSISNGKSNTPTPPAPRRSQATSSPAQSLRTQPIPIHSQSTTPSSPQSVSSTKTAPTIPRKPEAFRQSSFTVHHSPSLPQHIESHPRVTVQGDGAEDQSTAPAPPPPRRSVTTNIQSKDADRPGLPSRGAATKDLMDEADETGMEELQSWEVLTPSGR